MKPDDEDVAEDLFNEREFEILARPREWPPLARRADGISVVDLIPVASFEAMPPHRKVLLLVLLLAVKDRATEIHFEPWRFEEVEDRGEGLRLFYVVEGERLELVHPPLCLAALIVRDLKNLAGLDTPRSRVAGLLRRLAWRLDRQTLPTGRGVFRLDHGGGPTDVELTAFASELGPRFFLTLSPVPESAPGAAMEEMSRLFQVLVLNRRKEPK